MKRWEPYQTDGRDPMHEDLRGEWVTFEEACKEINHHAVLAKARAEEIHRLNNELTSVTLERDALKRGRS
jgi:hypothetical protein